MRFLLLKDLIHPLKNLPSRFRGPHPTFEPFLSNFKMGELEPPKSLLLSGLGFLRFRWVGGRCAQVSPLTLGVYTTIGVLTIFETLRPLLSS
eukprot:SAG22_NODE_1443_length_4412_cov_46.750058_2_plen_92_part_00